MPRWSPLELREVAHHTRGVTLGEDIRQARERAQMTQGQLAIAVGVGESTVSNWERGKVQTPKNRLARIREVLNMDQPRGGETISIMGDEDSLLANVSDQKFWLEAARRALRLAETGDTQQIQGQPKRGRDAALPEHLRQAQASERRKSERR